MTAFFSRGLFSVFLILGLQNAIATVSISSIRNASNYSLSSRVIYGGVAGRFDACNQEDIDNGTVCDNCIGLTTSAVCNRKRIYDNLELSITISSDSRDVSGATTKLFYGDQEVAIPSPVSGINTNDSVTVNIPWGNICNAVLGTSSCDSSTYEGFNKTFTLGFSNDDSSTFTDSTSLQIFLQPSNSGSNNDDFQSSDPNDRIYGFSSFKIFPGDEKVYLDDSSNDGLTVSANFPSTKYQPVKFTALRLFFEEGTDFTRVTPASSFVDFELIDPDSLLFKTSFAEGLKNGQQYVFRAASVDTARNVTLFFPDSYLNLNDHSATPNPVYGLLDGNTNCFIASATFGSKWSPEVQTFRDFRNRFLHPYSWGQKFTRFYYNYSPFWAKKIQENSTLKTLAQLFLWPLWAVISLLLHGKLGLLLICSLLFLITSFTYYRRRKKKLSLSSNRYTLNILLIISSLSFPQPSFSLEEQDYRKIEVTSSQKLIPQSGDDYELIRHPHAKKGLKRITKKGIYLYHVDTSSNDTSGSFKMGFTDIPKISSTNSQDTINFSDVYGSGPINTFYGDYEWKNLVSTFGFKIGTGLSISFGNGQIQDNSGQLVSSKEKFQLWMIPLDVGLNWRWELFKKQMFVPYFYGGFSAILLMETRDDKNILDSKFAYSLAGVSAGGIALRLDSLDPSSTLILDRDYGINSMFLVAEYRIQQGILKDLDFTTNSLNVGIIVDF